MVFSKFTELYNHHHKPVLKHFIAQKELSLVPFCSLSLLSSAANLLVDFLFIQSSLFYTFHVDGVIHSVVFCVWLFSLSIIFFEFYPCCSMNQCFRSFLLPNSIPLYAANTFCLFIHELMNIWVISTLYSYDYLTINIAYEPLHPNLCANIHFTRMCNQECGLAGHSGQFMV